MALNYAFTDFIHFVRQIAIIQIDIQYVVASSPFNLDNDRLDHAFLMAKSIANFAISKVNCIFRIDAYGICNSVLIILGNNPMNDLIGRILYNFRCKFTRNLFCDDNTLTIGAHFCKHISKMFNSFTFWVAQIFVLFCWNIFKKPVSLLNYKQML